MILLLGNDFGRVMQVGDRGQVPREQQKEDIKEKEKSFFIYNFRTHNLVHHQANPNCCPTSSHLNTIRHKVHNLHIRLCIHRSRTRSNSASGLRRVAPASSLSSWVE
jgi:hypothetical protein